VRIPMRIALALLFVSIAMAADPVAAPAERAFKRFPILVPDGWHYKEVINGDVQSCFVSKEDIDAAGKFTTGVSVYVRSDVTKNLKKNRAAAILAMCSDAFSKEGHVFDGFQSQLRGHGLVANYRYVDETVPDKRITVFNVLMEDAANDQMVQVVCEAPVGDFDAMMKTLNPMLEKIEVKGPTAAAPPAPAAPAPATPAPAPAPAPPAKPATP
jgi:hypothetical protein